jgi:hypothetical protein
MPKTEVEEITHKTLAKGGVLTKLYFDMQSEKPADLQPLMADLINNRLLKAPGVVYCFGAIDEPIKTGDTYSTSAIVTVLFKDLWSLVNVAFAFTPAGVEVLKPDNEYVLKPFDLQALVLNVAAVSLDYSNYILSRALTKEDYAKVLEDMKHREELGKKLMEGKGAKREQGQ